MPEPPYLDWACIELKGHWDPVQYLSTYPQLFLCDYLLQEHFNPNHIIEPHTIKNIQTNDGPRPAIIKSNVSSIKSSIVK